MSHGYEPAPTAQRVRELQQALRLTIGWLRVGCGNQMTPAIKTGLDWAQAVHDGDREKAKQAIERFRRYQ